MCSKVWDPQLWGAYLEPSPASGELPWDPPLLLVGNWRKLASPSGGPPLCDPPEVLTLGGHTSSECRSGAGCDARAAPLEARLLCQQPGAGGT